MTRREELVQDQQVLTSIYCDACSPANKTCGPTCNIFQRFTSIQLELAKIDRAEREGK